MVVGKGVYGSVFRCAQDPSRCYKVYKNTCAAAIVEEAYLTWRVQGHPNIIGFRGFRDPDSFYMEYVDALTYPELSNLRKNGIDVPALAAQLYGALEFCHARDVIHGDVTPANILIDRQRHRVKLIDFSISALLSDVKRGKQGTQVFCTISVRPPECLLGMSHVSLSEAIDLWSAGAVVYFWLMDGAYPFGVGGVLSQLMHITAACGNITPATLPGLQKRTTRHKYLLDKLPRSDATAVTAYWQRVADVAGAEVASWLRQYSFCYDPLRRASAACMCRLWDEKLRGVKK